MVAMSDQPPALRAAVADLQRALAGQPAETVSEPDETTPSSEPAADEPADPPR
jgi:hypothetical protein